MIINIQRLESYMDNYIQIVEGYERVQYINIMEDLII